MVHCRTEKEARRALAALEVRMEEVGLRLHPDKTKIVYCQDGNRRRDYDGPVSFDLLGCTFRARAVRSRHGEVFTGFGPAASGKAMAGMSEAIAAWDLKKHVGLSWKQLAQWIGPVIRGWMTCYGRFYRSELHPLLARINFHVQQWARAKYRRLRPHKALLAAWERVTGQYPGMLPHWKWVTWSWG